MVTQAEVAEHRALVDDVVTLAVAELVSEWPGLPLNSPERVRDLLAELMDDLTQRFAATSAVLGAEWFDDLRVAEGAPGFFDGVLPDLPDLEALKDPASYAASALYVDQDKALRDAAAAIQRIVADADRSAIEASVNADPARPYWARSAQSDACAFCALLATRGPAYRSEETAGGDEANRYHVHCSCVAVPVWDRGAFEVPDYVGDWLGVYTEARSKAGPGAPLTDLLAQMRLVGDLR